MNILVVNGPNLNLIGKREPEIYGSLTYDDLLNHINNYAKNHNHTIEIYQSNSEGEIIDILQNEYSKHDAIIINPAAYTHYSYAIYDCLKAIDIIKVEVHLTDIYKREAFRSVSVTKTACDKQFYGKGFESYIEAIKFIEERGRIT